jgi:hypothetical protein
MTGLLFHVVVEICAGSTLGSIIVDFHAATGVTGSVITAGEEPSELFAMVENV